MAGIDKIHTDSYEDYKVFKDWANKQVLIFFNNHKVCIGDWVCRWNEEDFNNGEIPIISTSAWLDIYLIQNCKSQFILDRMKLVYGVDFHKDVQGIDLKALPPEDFKQNRKITIKRSITTKFPLHKKPYIGGAKWWLCCLDNFGYCDETKVWTSYESYYPRSTNVAVIKSIKGVVRHLRKQYLPKGITFSMNGSCIGEDYLITIS
jgi:hypothetical protein